MRPVEVMTEGEDAARSYYISAVLLLIMFVPLVQSLSRKSLRGLRARLSITLPYRIAPAYVMLLEVAILLLTLISVAYVFITVMSDDTDQMEKVRVRSVVPLYLLSFMKRVSYTGRTKTARFAYTQTVRSGAPRGAKRRTVAIILVASLLDFVLTTRSLRSILRTKLFD